MITNADAGTADEEYLEAALAILRESCSVEVQATSKPGELDGVLQRAASRRIVVAGGDGSLHAVVAALHRRHDLTDAVVGPDPDGHRQRLRPLPGDPARRRGGGPGRRRGRGASDGPDRRRARRDRGQQRAHRRRRPGQPPGRPLEGAPGLGRRRPGQPRQARLPDRGPPRSLPPAQRPHARRGGRQGRHRRRPAGADGLGRQRRPRGRRHRAHPRGRPARRQGRRDDQPRGGAGGQGRLCPAAEPRGPPPPRRRAVPPGDPGRGLRRRVLDQRRRRDQRTGAAAHLARRAGGLLVHPACEQPRRRARAGGVGAAVEQRAAEPART